MEECSKWIDSKTGRDLMAGEVKDNDNKKRQIKGEERHLAKDPNYVPKAYYHAGVQREEVPKESSMTEDDEDNLEDSLDEDRSDASVAKEEEDDDKGSPKTPEAETLEQLKNILKLEPLKNLKKDFRDYKDEKERKEVWTIVYEALTGLSMDRIRELADQQQKKVDAEKKRQALEG